jgi:2-polyprenyl-3-methyl-5-hydroxy-6-metoxy-1,4-benzoquinol methylase
VKPSLSLGESKNYQYPGSELDVFALATNWKRYYASFLKSYFRGRILEVGAGVGNNTLLLAPEACEWWALEPDGALFDRLRKKVEKERGARNIKTVLGSLGSLDEHEKFDLILYLDVLEHIEDDQEELHRAARHLTFRGHLAVLSPAHSFLYSEFDRVIGHFRRYNRRSLTKLRPLDMRLVSLRYLDSCGTLLSLASRVLKLHPYPTRGQILFWDRFIVPLSRFFDLLSGFRIGKSILGVWEKF